MHYTTKGMDVADIMFLGRWRSSAVFRYIEEAMEEMPANRKLLQEKAKNDPFLKEAMEVAKRGELVSAKGSNQTNTLIPTAKKRTQMRKRPRRYPERTRKSRTSGRFPETHVAELRMS